MTLTLAAVVEWLRSRARYEWSAGRAESGAALDRAADDLPAAMPQENDETPQDELHDVLTVAHLAALQGGYVDPAEADRVNDALLRLTPSIREAP